MRMTRRDLVQATAVTVLTGLSGAKAAEEASGPIRVGLLTVKTGPLASGGIDMERALVMYLKERNNELAGRKIDLIVADTAGVPATARTKTQELVERNNVHCLIGPLAAFEALAIDDYIRQTKTPTLSVAAAEDMTQRRPEPLVCPGHLDLGAICPSHGGLLRQGTTSMITIADDIAYGQEMCAGFQRVFEESGGKVVQKLFPPLTAPDYGAYVAGLKTDADGIFLGFAGSNGFRFLRQFVEYGLKDKLQSVGGMTALDEAVLRNMGDEALGIVTACWYSAELDNEINKQFAASFRKEFSYDPGFYAAATYVEAAVLEAALKER